MKVKFTVGRLAAFQCEAGKSQSFLWDTETPGLGLRATSSGAKSFVFQRPFAGTSPRITIGKLEAWKIPEAQKRARELQQMIDSGRDPRVVIEETIAKDVAKRQQVSRAGTTVREAWEHYLREGKPKKKDEWKPRYRADLMKAAAPGGLPKKRGKGLTRPGHLAPLMELRLAELNGDVIRAWLRSEARSAPIQAPRAFRMFSGFVSWCATQPEYRDVIDRDCARAADFADLLPGRRIRTDALEIGQLKAWWAGTEKLASKSAAAYLRGLLLTGARREELAALKWTDIDFRWKKLRIADKVDATRTIPLTPYLELLLHGLPRVKGNDYVFTSPLSKSGHIAEPRSAHESVLADAAIPHVSIHGLRRSFALMGEAAGAPAGALAQIMGHRPSSISEGYKPRPLDALRVQLQRVEAFVLEHAGVEFDGAAVPAGVVHLVRAA